MRKIILVVVVMIGMLSSFAQTKSKTLNNDSAIIRIDSLIQVIMLGWSR